MDTALLNATAPVVAARTGSSLTSATDALELLRSAKVTSAGPVLTLDASTLTVAAGAVVNLLGGSLMRAGDLFSLANGSTLRTLNGPLLHVANGSALVGAGALAAFFGVGGNVINVANALCAALACYTFPGGITVAFGGAPLGNVSIGPNPFTNPALGSLVKSANAAVILVEGASNVSIGAPAFVSLADVSEVAVTGSRTLVPSDTLRNFDGATIRNKLSPFAAIGGTPTTLAPNTVARLEAAINQPTFTTAQMIAAAQSLGFTTIQQLGSDDLFEVLPGASVTLAGSLARGNNSVVVSGHNVLNVAGSYTSTGAGAVIDLDPSLYKAFGDFVSVGPGATMVLAGPLIKTADSIVATAANVVQVAGGTVTTSSSLLALARTDVVASNNLVRLVNGAQVIATAANPLVSFDDVSYQGGTAFNTASGGSLLRMFSSTGQPGTSLSLTGPYVSSINGRDITSRDAPLFNIADGATLISTTTQPFASFQGTAGVSHVTTAGTFFNLDTHTSFMVPGQPTTVGSGAPAILASNGALIQGFDVSFSTSNDAPFVRLHDAVTLTQSGNQPLIVLDGSSPRTTTATIGGSLLNMSTTSTPAPALTVAAGLLSARNTSIETGNRQTNTFSLAAILDGSQVTQIGAAPFISLDNSAITTAGNVLTLRRSSPDAASRLTLEGPLFVATNGSRVDTSSLGAGTAFGIPSSACCNGFHVSQGGQLIGHSTSDLIRLVGSDFRSGPDAFSGGNFFQVADTFTGAPATELVAPATVTMAGRLLSTDGSSVGALFSLLGVFRSSFTKHDVERLDRGPQLVTALRRCGSDPTGQPDDVRPNAAGDRLGHPGHHVGPGDGRPVRAAGPRHRRQPDDDC